MKKAQNSTDNRQAAETMSKKDIIAIGTSEIFDYMSRPGRDISDGVLMILEKACKKPEKFQDVEHFVRHVMKYGKMADISLYKRKRREMSYLDMVDDEGKPAESIDIIPESGIISREQALRLYAEKAIQRIKHDVFKDKKIKKSAKKAFFLYYFKGLRQSEIAIELNCTPRTVRNHLNSIDFERARSKYDELRKAIESLGGKNTAFGCDMRSFITNNQTRLPMVSPDISYHYETASRVKDRKTGKLKPVYRKVEYNLAYKNGKPENGRHEVKPSEFKMISMKPKKYYITEKGRDLMTHEKPKANGAQPVDYTRDKAHGVIGRDYGKIYPIPANPFYPFCRRGVIREKWGL